ncbi:hypothetical protein J1614_010381 [Plenodomus biglobosus]|nr:hypothetical protein J1614_010381 [Plenodomus biglobosus]
MRPQSFLAGVITAAVCINAAPAEYMNLFYIPAGAVSSLFSISINCAYVFRFITPSIFEKYSSPEWPVVDEWTLCEKLGQSNCAEALKPHWDNFVSINDFWKIKQAGFNVVRIPVGYVEPWGPYAQGAAIYLDAAVDWARETGLKIIIDLHGAPKSQNGFDHSGHKAEYPAWGDADSISYTHTVLKVIETKYGAPHMHDVVVAIQVLNEPFLQKLDKSVVKQFYRDAFYNLREISDTPIMLHDGFLDPSWMNGFLTPQDNNAQGVIVDHHEYQIFSDGSASLTVEEHLTLTCNLVRISSPPTPSPQLICMYRQVSNYANSDKWTIVGEWSAALTDCAPNLNGFHTGSRLEGTLTSTTPRHGSCAGKSGPVASWTPEYKTQVRRYIETQLDAFESLTQGWVFWNFKTEGGAGEWDLFQLLDGGVWPIGGRAFERWCRNF